MFRLVYTQEKSAALLGKKMIPNEQESETRAATGLVVFIKLLNRFGFKESLEGGVFGEGGL